MRRFHAHVVAQVLVHVLAHVQAAALAFVLGLCLGVAPGARAEVAPDKLPTLSGRVVDNANVLTPETRAALTARLKDLEYQSSIQFVVATVPSLQGEEIEPYANALFRKWQLGQKAKNNGLLFLIAPKERKLRFEVGYGLEGVLTDALTKLILRNAVGPKLKANDYPGGITAGVDEAIAVMTTDKSDWEKRPALAPRPAPIQSAGPASQGDDSGPGGWIVIVGLVLIVGLLFRFRRSINWSSILTGMVINSALGGGRSGGGSSSDSSDSFSGGGGDSGGGGSSDDY